MKIKIENTKLKIIDKSALHRVKKAQPAKLEDYEQKRSKKTIDLSQTMLVPQKATRTFAVAQPATGVLKGRSTDFYEEAVEEPEPRLNFTQVIESPGSDLDSDKGIQEEAIAISNPLRQSMNRR